MPVANEMIKKLNELIPHDKPLLFFCIGTDRSTGDCLGPLVGSLLKARGIGPVVGTIHEPVHAENIFSVVEDTKLFYPNHFIVAIDALLGKPKHLGQIYIEEGPMKPGAGLGRNDLPEVGDIHITGVVNVAGPLSIFIINNTPLSRVLNIAKQIADICQRMYELSPFSKSPAREWVKEDEELWLML